VAAIKWLVATSTPTKIAVGGFSAGGTISLNIAQQPPDGVTFESVVAVYSPVDLADTSHHEFSEKDPFIRNVFHEAYLRDLPRNKHLLLNPRISPAHANPASFPTSVVLVAARIDPNIKDIELLIEKVQKAKGIRCIWRVYENCFHGWNYLPGWLLGSDRVNKKYDMFTLVIGELCRVFGVEQ
jgi:acetyl esterase/lipase